MKKLTITTLAIAAVATAAFSMGSQPAAETSDQIQARQNEQLAREAAQQVGPPSLTNFTEKRLVRWLYELRDEPNYRTYSYIITITGEMIKICDSVGYGINASIQFSNPERVAARGGLDRPFGTIPQAEPNGLFMPEGLAATYVMCVVEGTEDVQAVYVEPEVIVSPFPLTPES